MQEETKLEEKEQSALVQKLSNLVSTGEDNISFSKIMTKLNKRQLEEIGTNRTTDRPINIVTKRLEEINNEKEDLLDFRNKQYYIEEKKQSLEEEIKNQENELNLLKELKIIQEKRHLEKEKIKINEDTIKEYNKKIENLNSKNNETKEENSIKQVNKSKINKEKILILAAIIFILTSIISITVIKNDILIAISVVLGVVTLITLGYTQYSKKLGSIKDEKLQNVNNLHIKNEIEILNNSCKKLKKETNPIHQNSQNLQSKIQHYPERKKERK